MYDYLNIVFGEKIEKPLLVTVSERFVDTEKDAAFTLFVTVLANFLMGARLLFSQRIVLYRLRTLIANCFFVKNLTPGIGELVPLNSAVERRAREGVVGREMAELGRGVRDADPAGTWNAYVMNNDRDLMTSGLILDLTSISNVFIKCGTTASGIDSPFIASRSRFTIPICGTLVAKLHTDLN